MSHASPRSSTVPIIQPHNPFARAGGGEFPVVVRYKIGCCCGALSYFYAGTEAELTYFPEIQLSKTLFGNLSISSSNTKMTLREVGEKYVWTSGSARLGAVIEEIMRTLRDQGRLAAVFVDAQADHRSAEVDWSFRYLGHIELSESFVGPATVFWQDVRSAGIAALHDDWDLNPPGLVRKASSRGPMGVGNG